MTRTVPATLAFVVLALCRTAAAEEIAATMPEAAGMSSEKLALVAPTMQKFVDDEKVAGAIAVVLRRDKIVLFESVGKRDVAAGKPMQGDTIFRIYSMSKPIVSVAAMMLVEEGKLALDDPLAKHLPEMKDVQVHVDSQDGKLRVEPAKQAPTIRDLLRHTSGLTYGFYGDTEVDRLYRAADVLTDGGTLQDMVAKLGGLPLLCQPGTRFNYGVSTDVLGRIVEVASGQRSDKFLQERLFLPLDLRDTGFFVPSDKLDRFACNYGPNPPGGLRAIDEPSSSRFSREPVLLSGGGGLVSTARDYLRFCQMLLNKGELGGKRLLREETVEVMTANRLPDQAYPISLNGKRPGIGFGLGFSVIVEQADETKSMRIGEYGWGGAASTHFWISPRDDLAVVVLTQLMPFNMQLETALKPLVYDAILKPGDEP